MACFVSKLHQEELSGKNVHRLMNMKLRFRENLTFWRTIMAMAEETTARQYVLFSRLK